MLTTYHFRAVVSNNTGIVSGRDLSFTTPRTYSLSPGIAASSAAWGDYDNDGLLDVLRIGMTNSASAGAISEIWRNTGGGFSNINAGLPGVYAVPPKWCDFDRDGRLDVLLAGYCDSCAALICQIWRNTGGGFSNINAGLPGVSLRASVVWGDYDNDGLPDVLVTGRTGTGFISQIWRNTGSGFTKANISLPGVDLGSAAWGDYDGDGKLDILLTGTTDGDITGAISQIWRNTGTGFTNINGGLTKVYFSSCEWGDYDNDGRLDILLAGSSFASGDVVQIWRNTGSGFININAGLPGGGDSVAWGDYDADGWLDVLLTRQSSNLSIQVWRNNNGVSFTNFNAGLPGVSGSVAWGDADNDGRLDVLLTGEGPALTRLNEVWLNLQPLSNSPPRAPARLAATNNGFSSILTWNSAVDDETPVNGLSYNLRVGTAPGAGDVVSPEAESAGFRLRPALGNAQLRTNAFLMLQPGTYYWSVQAVDGAFAGGPFATESTFVVPQPALNISLAGTNALISWRPSLPGWILQQTLSLSHANWINAPTGATNPVTIPASQPATFYRIFSL